MLAFGISRTDQTSIPRTIIFRPEFFIISNDQTNGNLLNIEGPANLAGQHYGLDYTYDSAVATNVTQVKDSFKYTSSAAYDYKLGKPLTKFQEIF